MLLAVEPRLEGKRCDEVGLCEASYCGKGYCVVGVEMLVGDANVSSDCRAGEDILRNPS